MGSLFAWIIVLFVFLLIGLFSFQVFRYYRQIVSGTGIAFPEESYAATPLSFERLQAIAAEAPGSGQLATVDDPYLGGTDAAVTVVEFADFGCPYSAEARHVLRALAVQFPDSVRFVARDLPSEELHPGSTLAAQAGVCAQFQDKYWSFQEALYAAGGDFSEESLLHIAENQGLSLSRFRSCLYDPQTVAEVEGDVADGVAAGAVATPTFFINGLKLQGAVPYGIFFDLLRAFTTR